MGRLKGVMARQSGQATGRARRLGLNNLVGTAIVFYEVGLDDVDERHPALARLVGRGTMFALGDSRGIFAQRNGNAHIRVYAAMHVAEDRIATEIADASPQGAVEDLASHFAGWAPELLQLILCGNNFRQWPVYALPVGHRWEHRCGITLIGDAAHLMSPFGGNGANLAMMEGAELALALTDAADWDLNLRHFEAAATARATEAAQGAAAGLTASLSPGALEHSLHWMSTHAGPEG